MRRAVALTALLLAGCAADVVDRTTGILVEVRRGPLTPVAPPGVDDTAAVEAAQVRIQALNGRELARGSTGADGTIALPVSAGMRVASVVTCPGALALPSPETVEVVAGAYARVALLCDTGIR